MHTQQLTVFCLTSSVLESNVWLSIIGGSIKTMTPANPGIVPHWQYWHHVKIMSKREKKSQILIHEVLMAHFPC